MNTMRMPALHTLLLFSKNIQTNETLSRLSCDDFLMIDLPYVGQGKTLILKAIKLRKKWYKFLNAKLQGDEINHFEEVSHELIHDLVQFMSAEASYTIKRLLKADLKTIYTFYHDEDIIKKLEDKNPFDADFKVNEDFQYGGIQVTENITYKW